MSWKHRDNVAREKIAEAAENHDNPVAALKSLVVRVGPTHKEYGPSARVYGLELAATEFFRRTYPLWATEKDVNTVLGIDPTNLHYIIERVSCHQLLLEYRDQNDGTRVYRWRKW